MKKILIILILLIVAIIAVVVYQYNSYNIKLAEIKKINKEYENFTENEILGTSLITLINKAINSNEKNNILKDDKGLYKENETTSIKIEVKFTESDNIFSMESIGRIGSEEFMKNYGPISFKCTQKTYHEKTNNIKYLLFEQI
ncbi:MAG: hypothetical protein HFJ41_02445 [Clostridia bacterium]|nr:hypothetical protein [Clostridia bacterium]